MKRLLQWGDIEFTNVSHVIGSGGLHADYMSSVTISGTCNTSVYFVSASVHVKDLWVIYGSAIFVSCEFSGAGTLETQGENIRVLFSFKTHRCITIMFYRYTVLSL